MTSSIKIMAHLVAGYPNMASFIQAVHALKDGGADILELQIPFSDPTADGPVITHACEKALQNGFKVKDIFQYIAKAKKAKFERIVIMTYANIAFAYGLKKFIKDLKNAGVEGIIIPDLPIEDEEGFYTLAFKAKLIPIPVVVVNMLPERLKLLKKHPFKKLYVSLRTGITGKQTVINAEVKNFLHKLKGYEIMAGFGIQSKEQIHQLSNLVDVAIIGSYFTLAIEEASAGGKNIYNFISQKMKRLI